MTTRFIKINYHKEMDNVKDSDSDDDSVIDKNGDGSIKDIESDPVEKVDTGPSLFDCDDDAEPSACAYCIHRNPNIAFWTTVFFISAACILPLEMLNIFQRDKGFWIDLYGSEDVGDADWCEAVDADVTQFIIEPSNSRSAYVFVIWGAFLVVLGLFDIRSLLQQKASAEIEQKEEQEQEQESDKEVSVPNPLIRYPHITYFNGIFNLLFGLSSFWSHACDCRNGHRAEFSGMLAVAVFPLLYTPVQLVATSSSSHGNSSNFSTGFSQALSMLPPIGQIVSFCLAWYDVVPSTLTLRIVTGFTVGIVSLVLIYLYYWKNKRVLVNTASCGRPPRSKLRHRVWWWMCPIGFACFGLGFWAWQMDKLKVWCFQKGILKVLQGHTVWHLLTAVSLICAYWMYRSEQLTLVPPPPVVAEAVDLAIDPPEIELNDTSIKALPDDGSVELTLTGRSLYIEKFKDKKMSAPSILSDDSSDSDDSLISDFLTGIGCPKDHRPYLI